MIDGGSGSAAVMNGKTVDLETYTARSALKRKGFLCCFENKACRQVRDQLRRIWKRQDRQDDWRHGLCEEKLENSC